MIACGHDKLSIHALIDGELDAANTAAIEARITACPECAAEASEVEALRGALRIPGARLTASASLRRQLRDGRIPTGSVRMQNAAKSSGPVRAPSRRAKAKPRFPLAAIAVAFPAFGMLAVVALSLIPHAAVEDPLTGELIADHVRSLQAEHLTDVRTSDRHVVKPWFNGRLDFAPPVTDLKAQGFPLAGGRMDYVNHRAVAAVVYKRGEHAINLFVWPETGETTSGTVSARDGYTVRHWRAQGMSFYAVSDVNPDDLAQFETALEGKAAPPPPSSPRADSE